MLVKLGVKDLVYFACRSGDLQAADAVAGPSAREGQLTHKKLQSLKTSTQQSEVSLKVRLEVEGDAVVLRGRVDLVDTAATIPEVIEIKSTYVNPEHLSPSVLELHWAQLKVYGYLLCLSGLPANEKSDQEQDAGAASGNEVGAGENSEYAFKAIRLQLACHNILDDRTYRDSREFDVAELSAFTQVALQRYLQWYRKVEASRSAMRKSANEMDFPFPAFRTGQYQMAASVYLTLKNRSRLLCEAPTGTGKTISTLFPACKALAEGHVSQIVYMTAKTSGRQAAFAAIGKLQDAGLQATSLVIHSKVQACHCQNGTCERNEDGRCPRTIAFFDRLPEAREKLLSLGTLDHKQIDRIATEFELCPFELALQMLAWVDIVVCDYNYVFDPLVRLASFAERENRIALLVDEAHNLSDRARSMYSASLSRRQNQDVIKFCKQISPLLAKATMALNRAMARIANQHDSKDVVLMDAPDAVTNAVYKCLELLELQSNPPAAAESGLSAGQKNETAGLFDDQDEFATSAIESGGAGGSWPAEVREWYKELFRYRVIEELFSDNHRTLLVSAEQDDLTLKLSCIDASDKLAKSFSRVHSAAVFSATLRPQEYFINTLGLTENVKTLTLSSPFATENLLSPVCSWIDTRYHARQQSAPELVELIKSVYSARAGNYLVFFPSYAYMRDIHQQFSQAHSEVPVIIQERSGVESRAEFLAHFSEDNATLGFAIMGGVFGEGVDYLGDQLVGAIVVGTGLPGIGLQQKLLSEHFAANGLDGFDYAFRYPGFTRVLQTAGRVIRSESDIGVVVLVDTRFNTNFYHSLFPAHWSPKYCDRKGQLDVLLTDFWCQHSNADVKAGEERERIEILPGKG